MRLASEIERTRGGAQCPEDVAGVPVERLEWDERKLPDTPYKRLVHITRRKRSPVARRRSRRPCSRHAVKQSGRAAATTTPARRSGTFGSSERNKFVMVNHVTTNSFFTATIYGCQDACA